MEAGGDRIFEACRSKVWDRVEFKMLSFSKLSVPSEFVDYLKGVRRLME